MKEASIEEVSLRPESNPDPISKLRGVQRFWLVTFTRDCLVTDSFLTSYASPDSFATYSCRSLDIPYVFAFSLSRNFLVYIFQ